MNHTTQKLEGRYSHWSFLKDCNVDSFQFIKGENVKTLRYETGGLIQVVREKEPHDIVTVPLTSLKSHGVKYFPRKWYLNLEDCWVKSMFNYEPAVDDLNHLPVHEGEEIHTKLERGYVPYNFLDPNQVPAPSGVSFVDSFMFLSFVINPLKKIDIVANSNNIKNRFNYFLLENPTQEATLLSKENMNPLSTDGKND